MMQKFLKETWGQKKISAGGPRSQICGHLTFRLGTNSTNMLGQSCATLRLSLVQ